MLRSLAYNLGHPFGDRREKGVKEEQSILLAKINFA